MPCDTMVKNAAERRRREAAIKKLEADIIAGRVSLNKNLAGEVSVSNWTAHEAASSGWCEGCALATLAQSSSWVVKSKLAAVGVAKGKQFVAASHNGHPHGGGSGHGH